MPPAAPIRIIGSYLSPYVRKVLVCLHEKGVPYEIDPIVPFFGDERFSRLSPLRRIAVPYVWGEPTDEALVAKTLAEDVPQVLDYLEAQAPADGFLFGELSATDVSVAVFFRNAAFARFTIDAARWPRAAGGAPIMAETYGTPTPRRGVMRI